MAKDIKPQISDIIGGTKQPEPETDQEPTQPKLAYKPVTVGLTGEQLTRLAAIATELGQPRHAVLKYAVISFIKRYEAGERPETVTVLKTS